MKPQEAKAPMVPAGGKAVWEFINHLEILAALIRSFIEISTVQQMFAAAVVHTVLNTISFFEKGLTVLSLLFCFVLFCFNVSFH